MAVVLPIFDRAIMGSSLTSLLLSRDSSVLIARWSVRTAAQHSLVIGRERAVLMSMVVGTRTTVYLTTSPARTERQVESSQYLPECVAEMVPQ